jgi:hypothetical protein
VAFVTVLLVQLVNQVHGFLMIVTMTDLPLQCRRREPESASGGGLE